MIRSTPRYDIHITLRPDEHGAGTSPTTPTGGVLIAAAINEYLKDDCINVCVERDDCFVEVLVSTYTRPDQVMIDRLCAKSEKRVNWTLAQVNWDSVEVRPFVF